MGVVHSTAAVGRGDVGGKPAGARSGLRHRVVLGAFALGTAVFAAVLACVSMALPAQSYVGSADDFGYVYSGAKSASPDFLLASQPEGTLLLFGSSELSTPASTVPQVPAAVFGSGSGGLSLGMVGQAYDQSLWHAIAAGAYGSDARVPRKVAIIVSPTWFADGGLDDDVFSMRFSYTLFRRFCDNPAISDASKRYLAERLVEQGVDADVVAAGMGGDLLCEINNAVYGAIDDLRLRFELQDVRAKGGLAAQDAGEAEPDFAELRRQAEASGRAASGNDWGYDEAFFEANIQGRQDLLARSQEGETYSQTPEYEDLAFFLQVCRECGLDPLVIVSPVSGPFFDLVGIGPQTRSQCYGRIASICEAAGVSVADFSDREYEPYFLHDIVHFGWTGWVDVEEAIWNHAKG